MALWTGLGQAATVAQLVGADIGGLISMFMQAALTARQNKKECEQLARRVFLIAQLLPQVQDREAVRQLAGLGDTLRDAHELVVTCQGRSTAYQVIMAGRQAERFKEVQSNIEFYLMLFPVISHIDVTRRLDRIYKVLVPDDSTRGEPSPPSQSFQLQGSTEVAQEVLPHGTHEFTFPELETATNNFALDTMIGEGRSAKLHRGRLHDGGEVAVKRFKNLQPDCLRDFRTELDILSRLRHKHIIRFLGSCVSKDKRLLTTPQKKRKKHLLTRWRKEPEEPVEPERLIVYEYMENGTLYHHLHSDQDSFALSPVTVSWKMRIDVLLGVSRAIEHLHCHASTPIIHQDIKSLNILLDASWVPCVSDFDLSVALQMGCDEFDSDRIIGTIGYIDPQYIDTGRLKPASDVYNLGMVMLEVLTGKKTYSQEEGKSPIDLACFALPIIEAGNLGELLDMRPVPEPTPGQLQALEHLAQTAVCCLQMDGKDRPAISDIVANLEMAHQLICRDELSNC